MWKINSLSLSQLEMANTFDALPDEPEVAVNEALCFIQQKSEVLAADDLTKICSDFYSSDEIEKARALLSRYVDKKRLPKQKGSDHDVSYRSVSMMVKVCVDPSVRLPSFCTVNIWNLPPVDATHVDMSAVLAELSALRREVRAVTELLEEVRMLKSLLHSGCPTHNTGAGNTPVSDSTTDGGQLSIGMSFAATAQQLAGDTMHLRM